MRGSSLSLSLHPITVLLHPRTTSYKSPTTLLTVISIAALPVSYLAGDFIAHHPYIALP
jgi:hypothetical protein